MKNAGRKTYVISESDKTDKYSYTYRNCTGVIIVGTNQEGEEVSFMSYQDPTRFLKGKKEEFARDLADRIREILERVDGGSVDAIIFGGNDNRTTTGWEHKKSIKKLSSILTEGLGFEPTVMTGPNFARGNTNVFFDTQNRRLYIVRKDQSDRQRANESSLLSEYDRKRKEWKVYETK